MSEIKERPILFSGPMVRAILEGRKTVTRRVVKWLGDGFEPDFSAKDYIKACPYGQPGDRLWVRESLRYDAEYGHFYVAGGKHGETVYLCSLFDDEDKQTGPSYDGLLPERSVPSIHLHRRYSRILLEITAVRIERLQDISYESALAEGVQNHPDIESGKVEGSILTSKALFECLWCDTYGDDSWFSNPWVWVVEFKRVTP